jgi:hypothetical protein
MSDTADQPADLPAILARIDRDLAESAKLREESNKFAAEQHKLLAEQQKLYAEQQKLYAEQQKLDLEAAKRNHWLAPALTVASVIGGLLGAAFIGWLVH